MMAYPEKLDIKGHSEQLVRGLRIYFRLGGDTALFKNDLQTLFTDLLLECKNDNTTILGEMNFDKFLEKLNEKESTEIIDANGDIIRIGDILKKTKKGYVKVKR